MTQQFSVESLRADFDSIFAAPAASEQEALRVLLTVRIGTDRFAMPIEALSGLKPRPTLVPIPSRNPHLLGLAGLEGSIVPVFRLPALLGYSVPDDRLRWLALCGQEHMVALAIESVESTVRVSPTALRDPDRNDTHHACINGVVQVHDRPHSVLDVAQLVTQIEQHARPAGA